MARNSSAFWRCARNTTLADGRRMLFHFVYEPHKPYSIASAKDSKERVIIVGSVSKTFAMTGWRMGYTLGPEELIQAIIKIQSQSTSNPTSIAQYAALEAMRGSMDTVPPMLAEYAKRETHRGRIARDSGCRLRVARRRVLCLPEYFGALQGRIGWRKAARTLRNSSWIKRMSRWCPAKPLERRVFCGCPMPLPLNVLTKDCGG